MAQQRDGESALVGFRNLEREGIFAFEILDPIPVRVHNGGLMAGSQPTSLQRPPRALMHRLDRHRLHHVQAAMGAAGDDQPGDVVRRSDDRDRERKQHT